jgi:hypothetical protein
LLLQLNFSKHYQIGCNKTILLWTIKNTIVIIFCCLITSGSLGLSLAGTEDLLTTVLLLVSLLSGGLLDLLAKTVSNKTVAGLKLLESINRVVDETKTSRLATTVLGLQTENRDSILLSVVDAGKLLTEVILRDVSSVGVENVNDELTTSKKGVSDELSSADGN